MILKILDYRHECNDPEKDVYEEWTFFDNIESASEFYNAVTKTPCVRAKFRDGNLVTFDVPYCAYLMNDNGKTIDKIVPVDIEQYGDGDDAVYASLQEAAEVAMNED